MSKKRIEVRDKNYYEIFHKNPPERYRGQRVPYCGIVTEKEYSKLNYISGKCYLATSSEELVFLKSCRSGVYYVKEIECYVLWENERWADQPYHMSSAGQGFEWKDEQGKYYTMAVEYLSEQEKETKKMQYRTYQEFSEE